MNLQNSSDSVIWTFNSLIRFTAGHLSKFFFIKRLFIFPTFYFFQKPFQLNNVYIWPYVFVCVCVSLKKLWPPSHLPPVKKNTNPVWLCVCCVTVCPLCGARWLAASLRARDESGALWPICRLPKVAWASWLRGIWRSDASWAVVSSARHFVPALRGDGPIRSTLHNTDGHRGRWL